MRTPALWLALAVAAGSCDRGGSDPRAAFWVGEAGGTRVFAVAEDGTLLAVAADAPAIGAPVRALLARRDGAIVVLQDVDGGAAPAVVLSPTGERVATFAATDAGGAALFDASARPWAAAEAQDGRVWVTGGPAPVLYRADGSLAGLAAAMPYPTRGIAALPDGRMLVTYGANGAAAYAADGATAEPLAVALGSSPAYSGLDAVAARPDGTVVVAVLRHGLATEGVLVAAAVAAGQLVALADPDLSARLPTLPSAIVLAGGAVVAGPAIGSLAEPACAARLSADLQQAGGCLTAGAHHGVARLP